MKFLTDHDVHAATVRSLISLGHAGVTESQIGLAKVEDAELLWIAQEPCWSAVTGILVDWF